MSGGFTDLRQFLDRLRRDSDLAIVTAPVDADLEAAEIHRRVIAAGGPALLFTNVTGRAFPLVTNLFGTARRAEMAFGTRPQALVKDVVHLAETLLPPTLGKVWGARRLGRELLRIGLRRRSTGPVTDVVTGDVRLDELPVLTCWPEDGGPFVTLPLVYTEHPRRPGHNLGMYRLQVFDRRTTGMHWQIGKGGGFHYAAAEDANEALPATVFLGGPPALMLAAIAPLPENVPELLLASLIAGERLPVTSGPGPHPLMAAAEFALIGRVPPRTRRPEGPFGDHYGYYSLTHEYPVLEISHLARRKDAIYPATVVGKPRQEDFFIGDLLQELLSPLFPLVMPAVLDLWSYGETGYHSLAAAVVRERYRREAMASAFRILGEGQLSLTKFLLLTDRPVDLRDFTSTLVHLLERTEPETDLFVFSNVSMDTLDYTGPKVNEGSKGVWLGLGDPKRSLPGVFRAAELPDRRDRGSRVLSRLPRRGRTAVCERARRSREDREPPGIRRLAAGGALRRAPSRSREHDELSVDDLHAIRARRRHSRRQGAHRPQPCGLFGTSRHRCAIEAGLPAGAHLPARRGGAGDEPVARVLSVAHGGDGRQ